MHLAIGHDIASEHDISRYLLPFQVEGVLCEASLQYTRKANRVGWTWTMALRAVRNRLKQTRPRDLLFTTQNWEGALEFGQYLRMWISIYDLSRFLILDGAEDTVECVKVIDGKKVAVQEKRHIWKFDNGSRIILFSSNPHALQTFEGDVDWDEAEFHEQQEEMHTALSTRLMWGYDYHAWSACNGIDTWVNTVLFKQASAPGSGWHVRTITIYDAIKQGIVERINDKSGKSMSHEEFLATCRRRVVTAEAFAQRFECIPSGSKSAIADMPTIESRATQQITRHHITQEEVAELFGPADEENTERVKRMEKWLAERFSETFRRPAHYRLGFDVAASGEGDLGSFWIDVKSGDVYRQVALLTTRTEDWHFLETALYWFMERPGMKGAGDGTGIGRNISWKAAAKFSGRFVSVQFTETNKSRMGLRLMMQLQRGTRLIGGGVDNADLCADFFGLQKQTKGNVVTFKATKNTLNPASHCDMAVSSYLTPEIDAEAGEDFGFSSLRGRGDGPMITEATYRQKKPFGL